MKKILIALVIIALVAFTYFKLKSNQQEVKAKVFYNNPDKAVLVETALLEPRTLSGEQTYLGTFEPVRENKIAAESQGKVVGVGVAEGQFIKQGQLIAKLDEEMLNLQLEALQINQESNQKDLNRYTELSKGDAIAGVQVEKAEIGTRANAVQIKQVKEQIARTRIVAPFSGVVTMRMFDLGSVLALGAPLVQLTDISSLKLAISVPERDVTKFKNGQTMQVTTDALPGLQFSGKVTEIAVKGDVSHNFTVKILVRNSSGNQLRAGMYGSVVRNQNLSNNALAIPREALLGSAKSAQVYVVENGKAVLKSFQAGMLTEEYVEVIAGLSTGQKVVVRGQVNLKDGSNVLEKGQ
jgi:RND family efflux transporter MFP subunit